MIGEAVNSEQHTIAEIERLELEARSLRRKIEHARAQADKRALNRLLAEVRQDIDNLRGRLD